MDSRTFHWRFLARYQRAHMLPVMLVRCVCTFDGVRGELTDGYDD